MGVTFLLLIWFCRRTVSIGRTAVKSSTARGVDSATFPLHSAAGHCDSRWRLEASKYDYRPNLSLRQLVQNE